MPHLVRWLSKQQEVTKMPEDVHPQIQAILDRTLELGIPNVKDLDTFTARAVFERMAQARRESYPPPAVAEVQDMSTGAGYGHVPVRVYRGKAGAMAPVIVFYHGGGHVVGSLETHDTAARFMARTVGCTVVSVDYRMGPEHPFPAAVEDAYDALRWVADRAADLGVDPSRVAVCGDSAGGNLAAVVAILARDAAQVSVSAQVLVYPVVDYRGGTPSFKQYGEGYGVLETDTVAWFMERYLPDADMRDDWRACPGNAASFKGLPPAIIVAAECDVLVDEGEAYAEKLNQSGTDVTYEVYPGMIHGFFTYLGLVDAAGAAHERIAEFLWAIWKK